MKTMSDFISVAEGITPSAVYSESYDWAEEYADVYEEAASQHTLDIYDSSDYKFFGEACFYQEASKGLIAGGILALVSGAFFMIMKLLKGGGGGGSSSSSSGSSNSSSKTQTSKTAKPESKFQKKEHGRKMEEPRTGKQAEEDVRKAEQEKHQPETKESTNDVNIDSANNTTTSQNVSNNLDSGDTDAKPVTTPPPQETKAEEKPKYQKPADLEAEENLVFDAETIRRALREAAKDGSDFIAINNPDHLGKIRAALGIIDDITEFMRNTVKEGHFEKFVDLVWNGKEEDTPIFIQKYNELNKAIKESQKYSKSLKGKDNLQDVAISKVEGFISDVEQLSRSIESNCKSGMRICKEERTKRIAQKMDVGNIDAAYKIFNGIIRDVNVVCRNIQEAYSTINKSLKGNRYPFLLNRNIYLQRCGNLGYDDLEQSDLDEPKVLRAYKVFSMGNSTGYIPNMSKYMFNISEVSDEDLSSLKGIKTDKSVLRTFKDIINSNIRDFNEAIKNSSEKIKYIEEQYSGETVKWYRRMTDSSIELLQALIELYQVPFENFVVKEKNLSHEAIKSLQDKNPDIQKLKAAVNKFYQIHEELKSSRPSVDQIKNDKNQGSKDSYAKSFIQEISNNIKMLEGNLDQFQIDKLKQEIDKISNDGDYDDDSVIMMHEAVKKRVYEHESEMNNEQWKRTAQFLENIGYKPLDVKAGDNVMNYKKYFDRPIPAKASDPSQNGKIKQIQRQPYELKFTDEDGKTETLILAGNCTYWKSDGPVDQIKNDKNQGSKDSDGSKQGEEKQSNVLYSPFNMQKFQHLPILGLKMFSGNDPNVYKNFSSSQRMYNTMSQIYQRLRGYLEKLKETKTYYEGMEFSNNQISIESIRIYDKYFDKNVKKAKDTKDNMHSNLRRLEKDHPELSQIISAFSTAMDNIYDAFIDMFSKNLEYYAKNDHNNTGAWNSYPELKKLDDVINNLIDDDDEDDYKVSVLYDNMFGN